MDTAAELQSALNAAAASSADDAIHVVMGVYAPTSVNGFFAELDAPGDLDISGGWYPGCIARLRGARSTIDGQGLRPGMVLLGTSTSEGHLSVSHLNFVDGLGDGIHAGGLTANPYVAVHLDVTIDANRFAGNEAVDSINGGGGGLRTVADGTLVISNNVFVDNYARNWGGAALLHCEGLLARIVGNTVTRNEASTGSATDASGVYIGGDCLVEVANDILWSNTGLDLALYAEGARLHHNDLAGLGGGEAPAISVGNVQVNPQFVSATNLRLRRSSPLIDAGYDTPIDGLTALDADGGPRLAGPHVDIGACELDRLFDDGFDPLFSPAAASGGLLFP
ncbi:MAG: choice-of-anchor Q domain-containing protein [Dokdonella sp.]|uniref:choice-of-anchor Q domain-containing protein n=1 Tax=Dokdonella sp. TaxID=2291710 RepID=UPI003F7E5CDC